MRRQTLLAVTAIGLFTGVIGTARGWARPLEQLLAQQGFGLFQPTMWDDARTGQPRGIETMQELCMTAAWMDGEQVWTDEHEVLHRQARLGNLPYWPTDAVGQPWPIVQSLDNESWPRVVAPQKPTAMPLFQGESRSAGLDPRFVWPLSPTLADELPTPHEGGLGYAKEARALLRPLAAWQVIHGEYPMTPSIAYKHLRLVPNSQFLDTFLANFPDARFLHSRSGDAVALYMNGDHDQWLAVHSASRPEMEGSVAIQLIGRKADITSIVSQMEDWGPVSALQASVRADSLVQQTAFASRKTQQELWEQAAVLQLRALGSVQMAYQGTNRMREYGSYDNLFNNQLLPRGVTRTNLIENYSLAVFFAQQPNVINNYSAHDARFTITAIPRSQKNRLRTFAICDDQTVRAASDFSLRIIGNTGNQYPTGDSPCGWEPVR
ncbi:MAG: hypothetical protein ABI743_06810 [bacterium]